jgi:ribonuclease T2
VNPRLTLALVALVLVGGAISLWWTDRGEDVRTEDVPSASAAEVVPATREALPPPQDYVLAISWHSAFCETKPGLRECQEKRSDDYTATHFALHGLWPQDDEYCGVGQDIIDIDEINRWDDLPGVEVSDATWRQLVRVMPGTMEQLERHEWVLHGSCAGVSAERYFARAISFVEEVNGSVLRDLFADSLGKRITGNQIRAAVDDTFGAGAGRKVRVDCEPDGSRELIYELRIYLYGDVMGDAALADLIHEGRSISVGCNGGVVDRVGEQ